MMAGMSGPQLAERVRLDYPAVAVVFMSGYTSDAVLRQGIESGEANFVQKPFSTTALAAKLRHASTAADITHELLASTDGIRVAAPPSR